MKKVLAIIFSILFFVSLSFAVIGCKKAEEQKPAEPAKTEAPAAPAPPAAPAGGAAPVQQSPLGGK
jgi:hypothetical protein